MELAFHTAAKRRRTMVKERHQRAHQLHDKDMHALLFEEARYEFHMRSERLASKIETFYLTRIDETRAFNEWKKYNEERAEATRQYRIEQAAKAKTPKS